MILEVLSVGLIVSAVLALFLDEVVYAVAALSGTFIFTALIYALNGSIYAAIFQFAVGVGTLAILFLSGEMLGEKPAKKASPTKVGGLIGAGVVFSLPALFFSVSSTPEVGTGLEVGDALWNLRGVDVLIQGVVILTVALGIAIVLFERRKK